MYGYGWPQTFNHCIQSMLSGLTRIFVSIFVLTTTIPTLHDHFPKPCGWTRPTGFSWVRRRWCHSSSISRWRRWRRELSPIHTADLGVFTSESAVWYQAVKTTVVWGGGRSGYNRRFGATWNSSTMKRGFFFQRKLSFGVREFSRGSTETITTKKKIKRTLRRSKELHLNISYPYSMFREVGFLPLMVW